MSTIIRNSGLSAGQGAFETAFKSWPRTPSAGGFVLKPGFVRLYSHPELPNMVFRAIPAGTSSLGLNAICTVGLYGMCVFAGKSLDRVRTDISLMGKAAVNGHNAASSSPIPKRKGLFTIGGASFNGEKYEPYARIVYDRVSMSTFATFCSVENITNITGTCVMEVLGNLDCGILFGSDVASSGSFVMTTTVSPKKVAQYMHGYLGRAVGLGEARSVFKLAHVRAAVLSSFPTDIRGKAESVYGAAVDTAFPAGLLAKLGFYYEWKTGKLRLRRTQAVALTTHVVQSGIEALAPSLTQPPADTRPVQGAIYGRTMNYGDVDTDGGAEVWLLPYADTAMATDVTGKKLGSIDADIVLRTMLPGLIGATAVVSAVDDINFATDLAEVTPTSDSIAAGSSRVFSLAETLKHGDPRLNSMDDNFVDLTDALCQHIADHIKAAG